MKKNYGSTFKIGRVIAIFVRMVKNSGLPLYRLIFWIYAFWLWSAIILHILELEGIFFASSCISIIFWPCNYKHLTFEKLLTKLKNISVSCKIAANSEAQFWYTSVTKILISFRRKEIASKLFLHMTKNASIFNFYV